jgi:3-oxoacyl-[acyl-carrier-protein] synthase-3
MSSATVPVALVEALEEGRVAPGCNLLLTGFGAGLSWAAHVVRWGERTSPLGQSDVELPPCTKTALEMVRSYMALKRGSRLRPG